MTKPINNLPPIHPGRILAQELDALKLSAEDFADQIAVPHITVTGILDGTRGISPIIAIRIGKAFGTTPEFWLNLQDMFDTKSGRVPRPRYDLSKLLAKCDPTIPLTDEDLESSRAKQQANEVEG